jgi:hypothetical protein
MLEDAALDLVQPEVVLVEHATRLCDVDLRRIVRLPGQLDQPVQVGAKHGGLGRVLVHALETTQLLAGMLPGLVRHAGGVDRAAQLLQFRRGVGVVAQLLADLAQLLAQHVLALTLVELLAGFLADLARQAQHLDTRAQQRQNLVEPALHVEGLEDVLLLLTLGVDDVRHHVCQQPGGVHVLDHRLEFLRGVGQQVDGLGSLLAQLQEARLDLGAAGLDHIDRRDAGDHERPALQELQHAEAALPLHHEVVHPLGRSDVARDAAGRADPVQVVRRHVGQRGIALQQETHRQFLTQRMLGGADGTGPSHRHRRQDAGKQDGVAHRNDDHRVVGQRSQRFNRRRSRPAVGLPSLAITRQHLLQPGEKFHHVHPLHRRRAVARHGTQVRAGGTRFKSRRAALAAQPRGWCCACSWRRRSRATWV